MLMKIVSLVGAALLLTAGCAGSDSGADNSGGKPSPTATVLPQKLTKPGPRPDLAPQDSPAADASFAEQLEYELQTRTLTMAHAQGKTTATCPSGMESSKGTKTTCTTTFNGLKVQWTVTIGDKADWSYDGGYVQYEATPSTGILTRDGVARLFFGNYSDADYLLCNNIPAAALVPRRRPALHPIRIFPSSMCLNLGNSAHRPAPCAKPSSPLPTDKNKPW